MTRKEAVENIVCLYPPDSEYGPTAESGREIVADVCCSRWRELPDHILREIAQAMQSHEHAEAMRANIKMRK